MDEVVLADNSQHRLWISFSNECPIIVCVNACLWCVADLPSGNAPNQRGKRRIPTTSIREFTTSSQFGSEEQKEKYLPKLGRLSILCRQKKADIDSLGDSRGGDDWLLCTACS